VTKYREVPLHRLVGVAEISEALGVTKSNVNVWIERRAKVHFPRPVKELTMGNLFDMDEVREWHRRWKLYHNEIERIRSKL